MRCECKELIVKGICDKGFNWNPSNCECECDKSCDAGEYLDYKNCKCRKMLGDKLAEECSENIDEKELHPTELHSMELHSSKMIHSSTLNDYEKICSSCTVYIVLCVIFFIIRISVVFINNSVLIYFSWYLKRKYIETTVY